MDPRLLALPPVLFCLIWLLRRYAPGAWAWLARWPSPTEPASHVVQALPAVVLGAIASASVTGDPWQAVLGAVLGALAPLGHHAAKAAPVPYRGALGALGETSAEWLERRAAALDRGRK